MKPKGRLAVVTGGAQGIGFAIAKGLNEEGARVAIPDIPEALADVGYEGWITLECVPLPTEYDCAKRGVDYLRALETVIRLERLDYREV